MTRLLLRPGHLRLRDVVAFRLTRIHAVYALRCWWQDRRGRPGFRASDWY